MHKDDWILHQHDAPYYTYTQALRLKAAMCQGSVNDHDKDFKSFIAESMTTLLYSITETKKWKDERLKIDLSYVLIFGQDFH